MNYLLYGLEKFLIDQELDSIKKKNNMNDIDISWYDLTQDSLKKVLEDANTISIFDSQKLIIVENSYIFTRAQKKEVEQPINLLEIYLKNNNPNTILIFISNTEKIDSAKKVSKLIKEKGIIIECNKSTNILNTVKKMFEGYAIDQATLNLFIKRVGNDLLILNQEAIKLKNYKYEEKIITKEDILALTLESIDTNIFTFVDNIINKNKKEALNTYRELLKLNEEPIKIIIMLANKFRLMYQACGLTKKGYSSKDISEILNVHKYPVELAIRSGYQYNLTLMLHYLLKLANMDENIKTGNIDPKLALELFIINL